MCFRRRGVPFVLLLSFATLLYSQTTEESNTSPIFRAKVPVVLVDVTVTDGNDVPISDLKKEDFEVFERGKQQAIASFEEHKGTPANQPDIPPLPSHFYSNFPLNKQTDSVNVLVMDALNTPLGDQANVRKQMVSYLKNIDPGPRLAIFTLTTRMRMVQGFTADPKLLLAALNYKNWGGGPQSSVLLRTESEDQVDQQMLADMAADQATSDAIAGMQEFQNEIKNFGTYSRVETTLNALQQVARYLAGFPGRKNVMWFSGLFPIAILPGKGENYDFNFSEEFKKNLRDTTNMLAAAQVAIYPIASQGLDTDSYTTGSHISPVGFGQTLPKPGESQRAPSGQDQNRELAQEHSQRYANQATMDEIAKDTGGEAYYNTNGLKDTLAHVISNGAHYYTISYTPADKRMDGGYRPIKVKLREGHYKLAYRRGYFAEEARPSKENILTASNDPLHPLMERGMPDSTQILYKIRVLPSDHQPDAQAAIAGDNPKLTGPAARYAVDFAVSTNDVDLELQPDGTRRGNLEVALVAYDHDGNILNWIVRSMNMSLKPQLYAAFQQGGVQLHEEIDVPKGDMFLRTGIYDLATGKAGTLEIPLSEIKTSLPHEPMTANAPAKSDTVPPAPESKTPNIVPSVPSNATIASAGPIASIPPASIAPATVTGTANPARPVSPVSEPELAKQIVSYCKIAASASQHSDALESACNYALSLRMTLPNIICNQDTERHWWEPAISGSGHYARLGIAHRDHVTAQVEYRNRQEYYSNVRIDGALVNDHEAQTMGAALSDGEFAMILQNIFIPSSKAEFYFVKEDKIHSRDALLFQFNIQQDNNHYYVLQAIDTGEKSKTWYPAYHGQMWLDKTTFHILRMERETADMPKEPITRVKTTTEYDDVGLGDGTSFVLPVSSDVYTCLPLGQSDCSHNIINFIHWHKFGTKTEILMNPSQ